MNRQAFRSALGRATPSTTTRALSLPVRTITPATFTSSFSTTGPRPDDSSSNSGSNNSNNNSSNKPRSQSAAVSRLSQLNNNPSGNSSSGAGAGRQVLSSIPGIPSSSPSPFRSSGGSSNSSSSNRSGRAGIDARSLRVSPDAGPTSSSSSSGSSGPRVLNIRSLRGGIRDRTPFGRGGGVGGRFAPGAGGANSFGRARVGFGAGSGAGGGSGGGSRTGGFGGGGFRAGAGRFGGARVGGAGRNKMMGRNGRGRRGGAGARRERKDKPRTAQGGKLVWQPEEQAVIDRLEKGEVVPFDPQLTMDSLTGYGAAVATDASIGQVETVLRTMRLMTGGMAFNSESGVTADVKEVMRRYRAKKPIFVHSKEEKAWIESAQPRLKLVGPDAGTKKAIIEPAILGKYEAAGFAEAGDIAGTMANYHSRTFTYMAADSQKFMDKVLSLLPAQQGGKPASQAKP